MTSCASKASTLGHDRPEADLLLGPGQPVVVRDWRARVLYGAEVAAVPSARLADGEFVLRETHALRLYTLRFAEDEVIWAEGVELACPAVIASQPAKDRADRGVPPGADAYHFTCRGQRKTSSGSRSGWVARSIVRRRSTPATSPRGRLSSAAAGIACPSTRGSVRPIRRRVS